MTSSIAPRASRFLLVAVSADTSCCHYWISRVRHNVYREPFACIRPSRIFSALLSFSLFAHYSAQAEDRVDQSLWKDASVKGLPLGNWNAIDGHPVA